MLWDSVHSQSVVWEENIYQVSTWSENISYFGNILKEKSEEAMEDIKVMDTKDEITDVSILPIFSIRISSICRKRFNFLKC